MYSDREIKTKHKLNRGSRGLGREPGELAISLKMFKIQNFNFFYPVHI